MSNPKVKIAALKNLLIFDEKYLPQSVRLLEGEGGWNAIWQNAVWTCIILTRGFPSRPINQISGDLGLIWIVYSLYFWSRTIGFGNWLNQSQDKLYKSGSLWKLAWGEGQNTVPCNVHFEFFLLHESMNTMIPGWGARKKTCDTSQGLASSWRWWRKKPGRWCKWLELRCGGFGTNSTFLLWIVTSLP